MKSGVIVLLFLISTVAANHLVFHERECIRLTESENAYDFILKHVNDRRILFYNRQSTCFMTCILWKNGTVKNDFTLNVESLLRKFKGPRSQKDQIEKELNACAKLTSKDTCHKIARQWKCVLDSKVIQSSNLSKHGMGRPFRN